MTSAPCRPSQPPGAGAIPYTLTRTPTSQARSTCHTTPRRDAQHIARRLSLSVRPLTYRLERIHKLTGANSADPAHRHTLQTAVIGARLLN
ncbi:helix-turn-helix domain-containing protein [Streptomyces mirabilis]|nr:helix-turn-helix domain-containing protein [Streptomyces mirabilis]MCX4426462.1 helix-turn-helix domain-containing protein [Streptomyces mirabilis]